MTQDEMDAENRKYLDTRIILVPLRSGRFAVYNNAGLNCGFVEPDATLIEIMATWTAPAPVRQERSRPSLEELGL